MKVAILSESPADDAALRIFAEAIWGQQIEPVPYTLRSRGWPSVRDVLKPVLLQLYYHTDAEGFILVVDSNGTPPHISSHEDASPGDPQCRLCQLRQIREKFVASARPRPDRPALKTAFGVAIPSLEAWLRCDQDLNVSEATWLNGFAARQWPYSPSTLKQHLYGTDRPSLALEMERMTQAALRLAKNINFLETRFPNGFGAFSRELRTW